MNRWELAALVLIAALLPCVAVAAFASAAAALAAVEVASVLSVTALMLLSEGFRREPASWWPSSCSSAALAWWPRPCTPGRPAGA